MRVIDAPGVEIKEIDKSGYAPAMTGSKCFVMGYADKGTPYEPMQFTSKAAWQNYYGDPENEAERYFYNACTEVINQNGVLNCARIPYDNRSKNKMVGFKFKVSKTSKQNPTAGEYLQTYPMKSWVDHDSDFEQDALKYAIDTKCLREIDGITTNGLEEDPEIQAFYNKAIERYNATYDKNEDYARYSIDYYKVDIDTSKKLAKRFVSQAQAIDYLKEFEDQYTRGIDRYEVDADNFYAKCLQYDRGDWVALPLYCKYEKENTIQKRYSYSNPLQLNFVREISCKVESYHSRVTQGGKTWVPTNSIKGILADIELIFNGFVDTGDITTLSAAKSALNRYSAGGNVGEEIKNDGYLYERLYELKNDISTVTVKFTVDTTQSYSFDVNNYTQVCKWRDGADNEFLWRNTMSALYTDSSLLLSNQTVKVDDEVKFLSDLWGHDTVQSEIWEPYKSMALSAILRYNSTTDKPFNSFSEMLSVFKDEGDIKFEKLFSFDKCLSGDGDSSTTHDNAYGIYQERVHNDCPYYRMSDLDPNLHDYLTITQSSLPVSCDLDKIDEYRTGEATVDANTFWIFDKTCATLNKIPEDSRKGLKRDCIGIFPVITTVANALYAQSFITPSYNEVSDYETIDGVITKSVGDSNALSDCNTLSACDIVTKFSQNWKTESDGTNVIDTVSRDANGYFTSIAMNPAGTGIDMENAKNIGVVVYKAYLDASEGNKVSFTPVESFCGSLDKNAKNPNTGVSKFIDNIINTQSDYIYFFSNCFASQATRTEYDNVVDFLICNNGINGMLGWFSNETSKEIALTGVYQGIDKCFKNVEDINERDIDIICDAGLANIAQYMKSIYEGGTTPHEYDIQVTDDDGNSLLKKWTCSKIDDVSAWKTVEFKYDNFCKNVRKDCMFIADGPRPLVLQGQKKIIRTSKPSNTIDANILPYVKYITGLNTNYGAGYMDWFQITDEFTGDEFWCPPSIKAMGIYVNTDVNFNYWDAPAGLNRGVVQALDCAFSPTIKQAGSIYTKNWNYAINYPNDGIVLEGQKTFQVKPSAFDRVNVRRLFLRLERQTYKVARYFVYEGNTAYTRQRLVDTLDPIFYQAKVGGGLYDYKIICDESINTPTVIDNNELKVKIGLKPTKTAEFILIDFIALSTGGSFSEM